MEKEIRDSIEKLYKIKKELVNSKWNFKSFDVDRADISVDLDLVRENDFISIMGEAYLAESFSRLKEKRKGKIEIEERDTLIKISNIHGNLLRLKLFFCLELDYCVKNLTESPLDKKERCCDINWRESEFPTKITFDEVTNICESLINKKDYDIFTRLVELIILFEYIFKSNTERDFYRKYVYAELTRLELLNFGLKTIELINYEFEYRITKCQDDLTRLYLITQDTLSKFGKYIKINNICEKFDSLLSDENLSLETNWFKKFFKCIAILDIDKERYVTKNGVNDDEKVEISSNAFKIKNILETLLTRKYISINRNVRYYMEDLKFITYEEFINSDKTDKPNRMFSCCEKKLFTMLPKNIVKNIHLIVTKELCVMCERAVEYYKTNNINMEIEIVENYSSLKDEDLKRFDKIAYEIYKKDVF